MFFNIIKHLLPNATAWRIIVEKTLRNFFVGLSGIGDDGRNFTDLAWLDILPANTREIPGWESQFGITTNGISEQARRDRLASTWKALGGQSPKYIQDTLRDAGFDVYVHEWWTPGTEPTVGMQQCVTPRNPLTVLRRESTAPVAQVDCGEAFAECGEAVAECGNIFAAGGYALVNKILITSPDSVVLCGMSGVECGEVIAECGNFDGFRDDLKGYFIPTDPLTWPYFLYIGGPVFGELASIPSTRRDEFEEKCLKIAPLQQWLGIMVQYT